MPVEYEELGGSLAALALAIVYPTLERFERTVTHIRFDQAVRQIAHLLLAATEEQVERYAEGLEGRFPWSSDPRTVLELRDRLVYPDPVSDAVDAVSGPGVNAFVDGRS